MNRIFILSSIYYCDLVRSEICIGLYSDIYRLISFKLGMMIETTELYILISVCLDDLDLHLKSEVCEKSKPFVSILSQI